MIDPKILADLKSFNWQKIIDFGISLDDLNDRQWRFAKGMVAELAVEKHAVNGLKYVGRDHCDYEWDHHNIEVELKSQLSGPMYLKSNIPNTKQREFVKSYTIKLNNSNGTNKSNTLDPKSVADVLVVVRNDGAFAIDRETVISNARKGGDGWEVFLDRDVDRDKIYELSGHIQAQNTYDTNLKEKLLEAIRQAIPA